MKKLPIKNLIQWHPELKDVSKDAVVCRKSFISDFNASEHGIIGIISSPVIDHEGDIIWPMGVNDKFYKTNPVIIFNHDLSAPSIGVMDQYDITPEGIMGIFRFSETYDFAIDIKNLIQEKIIRGISISFIPTKELYQGTKEFNSFCDLHKLDKQAKRIVVSCDWIETSIVNVGCCPEALILAAKSFTSNVTSKNLKVDIEEEACKPEEKVVEEVVEEPITIEDVIGEVIESTVDAIGEEIITPIKVSIEVPIVEPSPIVEAPEAIPEVQVQVEEVKRLKINIIRVGKMVITEEIKNKALLFSQGKCW